MGDNNAAAVADVCTGETGALLPFVSLTMAAVDGMVTEGKDGCLDTEVGEFCGTVAATGGVADSTLVPRVSCFKFDSDFERHSLLWRWREASRIPA